MQLSAPSSDFGVYYEIVRAKLAIRDYYLKTIIKSIYENTGQLLSLVRIQLAIIKTRDNDDLPGDLAESGALVAQVICNLRDISKNLAPEKELLSESGLINALRQELCGSAPGDSRGTLSVSGVPCPLPPGPGLIFFSVILDVLSRILSDGDERKVDLILIYSEASVKLTVEHAGDMLDLFSPGDIPEEYLPVAGSSIKDRMRIIGGRAEVSVLDEDRAVCTLEMGLLD